MRSRVLRVCVVLSFGLGCLWLWVLALQRLGSVAPLTLLEGFGCFAVALSACVLVDLLSGLVHCLADHLGDEHTPFWGPTFVRNFRLHHEDPQQITTHDFVELSFELALAAWPLLAAALTYATRLRAGPGISVWLAAFFLALYLTNWVHRMAHEKTPPWWVRVLQGAGLILRHDAHARHHRAPFHQAFCITFGWLNPILDRMRFFERVLRRIRAGVLRHP